MRKTEIISVFKKTQALLTGHFLLTSGLHSAAYVQCAKVLQYPKYAQALCRELANKFKFKKIDVVVGPALGGVIVAYEVARSLKVKGIFTERDKKGKMCLRRNFTIAANSNVLVVEDVITTAGSVKEVINLLKKLKVKVIGLGCLVDRTKTKPKFVKDFKSLIRLEFKTYKESDCPLCKELIELVKPGSRKIKGV
ncbi:MAG: orotate phosphoribosyltransferase [Candidatus Gygaella obscura]|nr:orotate phosphoribosyltransferase [Candidatus Gygaella obscura]